MSNETALETSTAALRRKLSLRRQRARASCSRIFGHKPRICNPRFEHNKKREERQRCMVLQTPDFVQLLTLGSGREIWR